MLVSQLYCKDLYNQNNPSDIFILSFQVSKYFGYKCPQDQSKQDNLQNCRLTMIGSEKKKQE